MRTLLPIIAALLLIAEQPVAARTWHVPSEAPTIQAGIDSAAAGDTVLVACGTYYESNITVKDSVVLRSEMGLAECVTIENPGGFARILDCVGVGSETVIEGFTLTGAYVWRALTCSNSDPVISNCVFYANVNGGMICSNGSHPTLNNCSFIINNVGFSPWGGGLALENGSAILNNCIFSGNSCVDKGGAINVAPDMALVLNGCRFTANFAGFNGGAVAVDARATLTMTGCVFAGNYVTEEPQYPDGGAVFLRTGANATGTNCTFYGNAAWRGGGLGLMGSGTTLDLENSIVCFSTWGSGVFCRDGATAALSCSDVYNNEGGDWTSCLAGQDTVRGNLWADPLLCDPENGDFTLQHSSPCAPANNPECGLIGALDVGCSGTGTVWIVPGDAETIQAGMDSAGAGDTVLVTCGTYYEHDIALKDGVCLRSVTGEADCVTVDAQQLGRVLYADGLGAATRIAGLTLTGGSVAGRGLESRGGGMACINGASPTLENVVFCGNYAAETGGGIYCEGSSSPTMIGCTISGNSATDAGGGVYCRTGSSPTLNGCVITGNSSQYGGGIRCYTSCSLLLSGCTISGNSAYRGGGILGASSCSFELENVILWGDCAEESGNEIYLADAASGAGFTCCDVDSSGVAGSGDFSWYTGNIFGQPEFCGPEPCENAPTTAGDYTLQALSPCLDAPGCGLIGALGEGCAGTGVAEWEMALCPGLHLGAAVPNPFNPVTEISYGIPVGTEPSRAVMTVYDPAGRTVRTLVDTIERPGVHRVIWDGTDRFGRPVASGVYFYRLTWNGESETRRMVLVR